MRIGIDLRRLSGEALVTAARKADQRGLWAVLVGGPAGTEATTAAQLAVETDHIHLAMWIAAESAHPHTLAEEIAVVDQLSQRRSLAVIDGDSDTASQVRDLLAGHIVHGAVLAPPPAQTAVPVWLAAETTIVSLRGELAPDQAAVDQLRDSGHTHIFVQWPGPLSTLARHLATRAAGPGFPQIVADQADIIAP